MYCKHCGQQITDRAQFCPYCGRQLREANDANVRRSNDKPQKKGKKPRKLWPWLAFLVLIMIAAAALIFSLRKRNEESSQVAVHTDDETHAETDISILHNYTDIKVNGAENAFLALKEASGQLGIQDISSELSFLKEDEVFDNTFYTFEQKYEDIPVYGRKETVVTNSMGVVLTVAGNYANLKDIETSPQIKEEEALSIASEYYGENVEIDSNGLVIYSLFDTTPQLSWDLFVRTQELYEECLVSAINGELLLTNPLMAFSGMKGIGGDVDNNNVEFDVELENGTYVMKDLDRNIFMYDAGNDTLRYEFCFQDSNSNLYKCKNDSFVDEKGKKVTIEDNGKVKDKNGNIIGEGAELVINTSTSNVFTKLEPVTSKKSTWSNKKAVTIYSRLSKIYDMWLSEFQCKGFNNKNGTVHAVCNDNQKVYWVFDDSENAYSTSIHGYDLLLLSFGTKNPLNSDTIGHEYMHGIVRNCSNLIYEGEPGAINEGLADVFGEISEDWIRNEELDGDCDWVHSDIRSIAAPNQSPNKSQYPDTYKEFYWADTSDTSSINDYGGVHKNSTVISHVAYLMSTGINGHKCFEPLSTKQIGKVFYSALNLIPSDCSFNELRAFTEIAADIMHEQGELTDKQRDCVSNAFFQVNILKTMVPVSKKVNLTVIPIDGDELGYQDYTIYIRDMDNHQKEIKAADIRKNGLTFDDLGDYELRIVDDKNSKNETVINVKVYEKGGQENLKVYTNCGVRESSEKAAEEVWEIITEEDNTENDDVSEAVPGSLENMHDPICAFTFNNHFANQYNDDLLSSPYRFWNTIALYATMKALDETENGENKIAETYRSDETGEVIKLSDQAVMDVINALFPGIPSLPNLPESQYETFLHKDGYYYLPFVDLDTEACRIKKIVPKNNGAEAIAEIFTHTDDHAYAVYKLLLAKNNKVNTESPEPYYYCIQNTELIDEPVKEYEELIEEYEIAIGDYSLLQNDSDGFTDKYPLINTDVIRQMHDYPDLYLFTAYKDINNDGIKEMLISLGNYDYQSISGIYTRYNKKVIPLLADIDELSTAIVYDDGTIWVHKQGLYGLETVYKISKDGRSLDVIAQYEKDLENNPDYPYSDGRNRISMQQFQEKYLSNKEELYIKWNKQMESEGEASATTIQ